MRPPQVSLPVVLATVAVVAASTVAPAAAGRTVTLRASVGNGGEQANGASGEYGGSDLSADGRFVAFLSGASNLAPGDSNAWEDVYLRDLQRKTTVRVSDYAGPRPVNGLVVGAPELSNDGRIVAYRRGGAGQECGDVRVHDLVEGTAESVPAPPRPGSQRGVHVVSLALSPDGRFVALVTARYSFGYSCGDVNGGDIGGLDSADGLLSIYDRESRSFRNVAAWSSPPVGISVSSGARTVAVERSQRIEAYDVRTAERKPVSVDSRERRHKGYALDPVISDDGRHVAFTGKVYVRDRRRSTTKLVGRGSYPALSADGRAVTFTSAAERIVRGDTNGLADVFVRSPLR